MNEVANRLDSWMRNFINSDQEIRLPSGIVTPLTLQDPSQVGELMRHASYLFAKEHGVFEMIKSDPLQASQVLLPKMRAIKQQLTSSLSAEIASNNIKEAKNNSHTTARSNIAAGKPPGQVVQDLRAQLITSGGYRGAEGIASDDAFKEVVKALVSTRDFEGLEELENSHKLTNTDGTPNKGSKWSRLKPLELQKAKNDITDAILEDANRSVKEAAFATKNILHERRMALFEEGVTNDQEREINQLAIDKLLALNDNAAGLEAEKLMNAGLNYNPFLASRLKEQQLNKDNPLILTNDELFDLVDNKDITKQQAIDLGYDPKKGKSKGEVAAQKLKDWNLDVAGVAKGLVYAKVKSEGLDAATAMEIVKTQGVILAGDLENKINNDMLLWFQKNPDATQQEAAQYLDGLTEQYNKRVLNNVTFNNETQRFDGYKWTTAPRANEYVLPIEPINWNGNAVFDYSGVKIDQLKDLGVKGANPANIKVLTELEIETSWAAMTQGNVGFPPRVSAVADALGISITDLLKLQGRLSGAPEYAEFPLPAPINE